MHIRKKSSNFAVAFTSVKQALGNKNSRNLNVKLKIITIMAYKISTDCIACGTCIDECPMGAISEGEIYSIDPDVCTECGTCADVCPSGAISL